MSVKKCDYFIRNAKWLVTVDKERNVIENGGIVVEKNKIVAVGRTTDLVNRFKGEKEVDASNKIVLPGFIQGHVHATQYLAKGLLIEIPLKQGLFERLFPYEANLTEEDAYISTLTCQAELIRCGVTTFIDAGNYFPEMVARATYETGMRGILARSMTDIHNTGIGEFPENYKGRETLEECLTRSNDFFSKYNGKYDDRLRVWLSLRFIQGCSNQLITEANELAHFLKTGFQTHAAHSESGVAATVETYGMRDIERLAKLDVLCPELLIAHVAWINNKELKMLIDKDVKIAHCPGSNIHSSYGTFLIGKFPELLDAGAIVCIGTDGNTDGRSADIIREMFLAVSVYKETRLDPQIITLNKGIEMITIDGAKASLWDDQIGSIEVGKKADIVIIDTLKPEWVPVHNPLAALVYASNGSHVDFVMADGKALLENGQFLTIDWPSVAEKAQKASDSIIKRAGLEKFFSPKWPIFR